MMSDWINRLETDTTRTPAANLHQEPAADADAKGNKDAQETGAPAVPRSGGLHSKSSAPGFMANPAASFQSESLRPG